MSKKQIFPSGLPTFNVDGPVTEDSQLFLIPGCPSDTNYRSDSWQYDLTQEMRKLLCSGDDHTKDVLLILEGLIYDLGLAGFRCFHIINLMLHESDNHWHSAGLRERVMKILRRLFRCVKSGELLHYFLPKVNIIPSLNGEEERHALGKLDTLLENPNQIFAKLAKNDSCHG